ncbi:TetR/AcrR family transcriptional regulator [Bradyrhizobium viridifuturi]|jgi:AcrR family transcriptional regulator|nr:TetR/AcrR family transcriptional regulator [Bradyrhizobium viridifuturi]ERF83558.1 MAG: long-chain acyl-CoA synthetase [Bradyrhizobium sp. DFCI-1]MCA3567691.1 TetR/AcrR family transcriptional regulator [Bradyrhizobium sp.]OYU62650.1 MAG: TetR/AcrR family transcriptional regulator [Bradyrhizobium sp. PARBB1]PSO26702.1 TetR/AcrR family transcriptional regulator [Bradyrhizobium sp. MOS004]QRI68543.1 TetR/AcrR family transcriptional regulator [Bradyrhizobium sp. PSBB068]
MKKSVDASAERPAKAFPGEAAAGSRRENASKQESGAPLRSHRDGKGVRAADRIRASASELFYREGIRAVGVDEVVERAGVTKPSLYRSFASKDDLAAAYMRDYDLDFWEKFENPGGKSYSDPREHVLAYIRVLSTRAVREGYRGCGLSNATVEYPSRDNPARQVAEAHKKVFRKRLRELAAGMGARQPAVLGDALLLLIEGIYSTGQQSEEGPAQSALAVAKLLIDASVTKG